MIPENSFEADKLREKSKADLHALTLKYLEMLAQLTEFVRKLRSAQVTSADAALYKEIADEYDYHFKNMKTLLEEIEQYPHYEMEEQTAVLEVGLEVVGKAGNFLLGMPEKLSQSNFGKTIDDAELMKGIEI
ncbi:MAG: hypothetical protein O3A01_00665 [bacterium]|nr:hypothetical protein [bacterium]